MAGRLYELQSNTTLVNFADCSTFGEFFALADTIQTLEGELAVYQAGNCKENLGNDVFLDSFKDKIAIFTEVAKDQWCEKDFFLQYYAYKELVDAGAKGVIYLDSKTDTVPGSWYGTYGEQVATVLSDMKEGEENYIEREDRIPWLHCVATDQDNGKLNEFMNNYMDVPTIAQNYPGGLMVNVTSSPNQWDPMFKSPIYQMVFHGFLPLFYFIVMVMGLYFIYDRLSHVQGQTFWKKLTSVPVLGLMIECSLVFSLGLFLSVDGMWSNYASPLANARTTFVTLLMLASMAGSVLVGLSFSDFRATTKRLRKSNKGVVEKYRLTLINLSFFFLLVEILGTVFRRNGDLLVLINMVTLVVSMVVSAWFYRESREFTKILSSISSSSGQANPGSRSLKQVLRHTTRWMNVATVSMILGLITGACAVLIPNLLWNPNRFFAYWVIAYYLRAIFGLSKVILLKRQHVRSGYTEKTTTKALAPRGTGSETVRTVTHLDSFSSASTTRPSPALSSPMISGPRSVAAPSASKMEEMDVESLI